MGLEARSVLTAVTEALDRLIDKADYKVRSLLSWRRKRRTDRLYGNLPVQPIAAFKGSQGQIWNAADVVQSYCASGADVVAAHGAAATKLDATEYALTMMLEELRSVMSSPPTTWRPVRTPNTPAVVAAADTTFRAA